MTTTKLLTVLLAGTLAGSLGCKKKEEAPPAPAEAPPKPEDPGVGKTEVPPATPPEAAPAAATSAEAMLESRSGSKVSGSVRLTVADGKVKVDVAAEGLTPGEHGFHIHQNGDCSALDASSAGDHFNPDSAAHGAPDQPAHHAGDFGNITADKDGKATASWTVDFITLDGGPKSALNRAFVIHEKPDDLKTQPSGNAGARVACGVVK